MNDLPPTDPLRLIREAVTHLILPPLGGLSSVLHQRIEANAALKRTLSDQQATTRREAFEAAVSLLSLQGEAPRLEANTSYFERIHHDGDQ